MSPRGLRRRHARIAAQGQSDARLYAHRRKSRHTIRLKRRRIASPSRASRPVPLSDSEARDMNADPR